MKGGFMYCKICKRNLDSHVVMPIHQHDPKCPERISWEIKNGKNYQEFIGKEWEKVVNKLDRKFYESNLK